MSFIEKLFGRLMNEPGAAVALERAQALHPIKAADQHKLALLDHDTVTALALEYSVRARAMTHFHEGENLRALSTVERNLKNGLGRMGSGGAAIFQAVADDIVEQLARGNYERDIDNGLAVFRSGRLTVRCADTPGSIAVLIAKYRRGLPRGGRTAQPRR